MNLSIIFWINWSIVSSIKCPKIVKKCWSSWRVLFFTTSQRFSGYSHKRGKKAEKWLVTFKKLESVLETELITPNDYQYSWLQLDSWPCLNLQSDSSWFKREKRKKTILTPKLSSSCLSSLLTFEVFLFTGTQIKSGLYKDVMIAQLINTLINSIHIYTFFTDW